MLAHDEPPGNQQAPERRKPKLQAFLPVIRQILEDDGKAPPKQWHTAHRIFLRLRNEHGYTGGETVVPVDLLDARGERPIGARR
jgi:hypothetical protein